MKNPQIAAAAGRGTPSEFPSGQANRRTRYGRRQAIRRALLLRVLGLHLPVPADAAVARDRGDGGAVHEPGCGVAAAVLPENVGRTVAIVVADLDDLPRTPGRRQACDRLKRE